MPLPQGPASPQDVFDALGEASCVHSQDGPPAGVDFAEPPLAWLRLAAPERPHALPAAHPPKRYADTTNESNPDDAKPSKPSERKPKSENRKRKPEDVQAIPPDDSDVEASKLRSNLALEPSADVDALGLRPPFPRSKLSEAFPPNSSWTHDAFSAVVQAWAFCHNFRRDLGLEQPLSIDSLRHALELGDRSLLLADVHIGMLSLVIGDATIEAPRAGLARVLEEAENRGYDWRSWCLHLNYMTWPEVLRQFADCAGLGEGNNGMWCRNPRVSARRAARVRKLLPIHALQAMPQRFAMGSIKACCFAVLWQAGSGGLTVAEVSTRIHQQGLRNFSVLRHPETVVSNALSRETAFKKVDTSTYALKEHLFHGTSARSASRPENARNGESGDDDMHEQGHVSHFESNGEDDMEEHLDIENKDVRKKGMDTECDVDMDGRTHMLLTATAAAADAHNVDLDNNERDEHLMWVERLAFEDYHAFSVQERAAALEGLLDVCLDSSIVRKSLEQRSKARTAKCRDMHKRIERAGGKYFRATDESLREAQMLAPNITGEEATKVASAMREVDEEHPVKAESLGSDRRFNRYWLSRDNDGSNAVVYLELFYSNQWQALRTSEEISALESELDPDGIREHALLRDIAFYLPRERRESLLVRSMAEHPEEESVDEEWNCKNLDMPPLEVPRTEDQANQQLSPPRECVPEQYSELQTLLEKAGTLAERRAKTRGAGKNKNEIRCFWCCEPIDKRRELHFVANHETLQLGDSNKIHSRAKKAFEHLAKSQKLDMKHCRFPKLPSLKLRRLKKMMIDIEAELPEDAMDLSGITNGRAGWLESAKRAENAQDVLTSLSTLVSAVSRRWTAPGYYTASLLPHRDRKGGGNAGTSGKNVQVVCSTFAAAALAVFSFDGAAKFTRGELSLREKYDEKPRECLPVVPAPPTPEQQSKQKRPQKQYEKGKKEQEKQKKEQESEQLDEGVSTDGQIAEVGKEEEEEEEEEQQPAEEVEVIEVRDTYGEQKQEETM